MEEKGEMEFTEERSKKVAYGSGLCIMNGILRNGV